MCTAEISRTLLARLLSEAAANPEHEICGLLFGDAARIVEARATANVAADPATAFEIDPAALFAALRAERAGGARTIGHYHSHPNGSTEPSPRDAGAAEPDKLWLILARGRATAWRAVAGGVLHGAFEPVALRVVEP